MCQLIANQGTINLRQEKGDSFMGKPFLVVAKPQLPPHVYSFSR